MSSLPLQQVGRSLRDLILAFTILALVAMLAGEIQEHKRFEPSALVVYLSTLVCKVIQCKV